MRKHPQLSHKTLLLLLLALCCIGVLATGTYAAFSTSGYVKRVVQANTGTATEQVRFSSNYLTEGGSAGGNRLVSVTNSEGGATIGITVCNYPQSDSSLYNSSDITYTITFTVAGGDVGGITLSGAGTSQTLKGGQISHNLHTLTVPKDMLDKIITVTATPTTPSGLPTLSANLQIVTAAAQQTGWTGSITGNDVDALNYQIHGTQQGTLTITWNSSVVSLSKWSAEALGVTIDTNTSSITFNVGGENQPTSYLLQFYWVNGPASGKDGITYSFTPSKS